MIVITGATGQLGRLVTAELAQRTAPATIRLTTRDPAKIADRAAQGFETARSDFDHPASLEAAFDGAGTLLLISTNGPNDVRIRQHRTAIDAARHTGVGRVVYTSFVNASLQSLSSLNHVHADTEAYLKASGLSYTLLRNNQYAENLQAALTQSMGSNQIVLPGAHGKVAYIHRADSAAAIAGALTQDGLANQTFDLTGPQALDLFEIAKVLSDARGVPVTAIDADPAEFGETLESFGIPSYLVDPLISLYLAADAGELEKVSDDAARLAGRPVKSVVEYVKQFV